ncbi:MAG: response regulator transcription factor [Accumulibacter sp.]|uniref:response regulator transcription factor n=1 Tax=Accumulibacter sp. TaxID=2053492 RepID=UPI003316093C
MLPTRKGRWPPTDEQSLAEAASPRALEAPAVSSSERHASTTSTATRIRIVLADDHQMFREALRTMLEKTSDFEIVAEASDGQELIRIARAHDPDIVCMDIGMPGLNGVEATRQLQINHPRTRVIALSAFADQHFVLDMLHAGATGYVTKAEAGDELVRAIRSVQMNRIYLCPDIAAKVSDAVCGGSLGSAGALRLGARERQVLQMIAEGRTSPEIAESLHLAPSTVDVHRRNIMRKLDLHSVAELTKYAIRTGITSA